MDVVHLKTTSYVSPLFKKTLKVFPSQHSTGTSYLLLKNVGVDINLQNTKHICHMIDNTNQDGNSCLILLQGECFDTFVKSKWNSQQPIISQSQIWILMMSITSAFCELKQRGYAQKLTHFKQYSIRRLKQGHIKYKLLFHSSMISQVDAASSNMCEWSSLYLSPQQLQHQVQVPQKSIVFSFGLLLLNLCSPCDRHRICYKRNRYEVDEDIISDKINLAYTKYNYSRNLLTLILCCLHFHPHKRWDFTELYQQIKKCKGSKTKIIDNKKQGGQECNDGEEEESSPKVMFYRPRHYNLVESPRPKMNHSRCNSQAPHHLEYKSTTTNHLARSQASDIHKKGKQMHGGSLQTQKLQLFDQLLNSGSMSARSEQRPATPPQKIEFQHQIGSVHRGTFGIVDQKQPINLITQNKQPLIMQKVEQYNNNKETDYQIKQIIIQGKITQNKQRRKVQLREQWANCDKQGRENFIQSACPNSPQFSPLQRRYSLNKGQQLQFNTKFRKQVLIVPDMLKEVPPLKLQNCLRPLCELIKCLSSSYGSSQIVGVWTQGDIYYGKLNQNGLRDGLAVEIYSNRDYYYGHFKQDKYHGAGLYKWSTGEYFFGTFQHGLKTYGLLSGDAVYQGYFHNNKRHGQGVCWYATGEIYIGNWSTGQRHGRGAIIDPNGPQFVGVWHQGKRRGEGCLENDQIRIAGYWNGQVIEGQSFIQYSNGDVFKGVTGFNLQKLKGDSYSHSGNGFQGNYHDNVPVEGEFTYKNGDYYVGSLHQYKRNGYGQYYYNNGATHKGQWNNNKKL